MRRSHWPARGETVGVPVHALAYERASRPKPAKLATDLALRELVQDDLTPRRSPEQIAGRLRRRFPDQPEMWVSTQTIYQSLYVLSPTRRGLLRVFHCAEMKHRGFYEDYGRVPSARRLLPCTCVSSDSPM